MGFKETVIRALSVVQERGAVSPERLAFELGKSPTYVKYSVLPALREISDCIHYNKTENRIKWMCTEEVAEVTG